MTSVLEGYSNGAHRPLKLHIMDAVKTDMGSHAFLREIKEMLTDLGPLSGFTTAQPEVICTE